MFRDLLATWGIAAVIFGVIAVGSLTAYATDDCNAQSGASIYYQHLHQQTLIQGRDGKFVAYQRAVAPAL